MDFQPAGHASVASGNSWSRRHDAVFLALLLASLLLLLALFTYSPLDQAWSVSGDAPARNAAGKVGALLADVLFHAFGYLAFAIPLLVMTKLVLLFRKTAPTDGWFWLTRSFGLLLSLSMLCALAEMSIWHGEQLPAGAGGILGQSLAAVLLPLFSFAGTAVVVAASLALGLMLYLEFSWLQLFDRLGGWLLQRLQKQPQAAADKPAAAPVTGAEYDEPAQLSALVVEKPARTGLFSRRTSSRAEPSLGDGTAEEGGSEPPLLLDTLSVDDDDRNDNDELLPWDDEPVVTQTSRKPRAAVAAEPLAVPIQPLEKRESKPSERAQRDLQGSLFKGDQPLPSIALLDPPRADQKAGFSAERLQELSRLLVQKLADFGVKIEVTAVAPGPVITRFEIQPAPGVKASKISNLARDLARSMAMLSVRVVEVIPGKSVMGIEVPNEDRAVVSLSEVLASEEYDRSKSPLTLALGHDIGGNPVITDLAKMPHLLVAGTTGSGKSVGVNAMLLSLLFKSTPDELRLILVDPKMLELSVYEGIPHLLTPVVTDMKEASNALRWSVAEMERRYMLMAAMGVRNIAGYNKKVRDAIEAGQPIVDPLWKIEQSFETQPPLLQPLPYIVIVIDEFADMMMMVGKKVEELIARIAQKARASGIHMILATQRPSVDVITGLIKANIPTRISFQVSSKIDSRTILDQGGAEQLLGHGDMLYMPPGHAVPERVHGAFVDDDEVHRLVAEWKQRGAPDYIEEITRHDDEGGGGAGGDLGDGEQDELYDLAVAFVTESGKCSISSVQRKLRIGYNRAARLVETMEAAGVVSSPAHNGSREVLAGSPPEY
ncbi:DNA translocase FtsK [Oceanospirillaceae bacterium ASx5O]|nr:DNA translocase FtsK [Oceanospirillaceae bacterium ASx5O]